MDDAGPAAPRALHLEWRFNQLTAPRTDGADKKPSETMAELGIVQVDDVLLRERARPFALPDEAEDARRIVAELHSRHRARRSVHVFGKGMGIAAPQIGVGRAAAVVLAPGGETITRSPRNGKSQNAGHGIAGQSPEGAG